MIKMKTIVDIFPNWLTTGAIFTKISATHTLPWSSVMTATETDFGYIEHSGNKAVAPIVYKLMADDGTISNANMTKLADYVYAKLEAEWEHFYSVLLAEYQPLNNYDMVESSTDVTAEDISNSGSATNTQTTNVEVTNEQSTAQHDNVYAFNSTSASPSDESTGTVSDESNTSGTITDNGTNTNTVDRDQTVTHTLTRSGNIGVTTSMQLLSSEIELWKSFNIFDEVYKLVDSILTLDIYEGMV